MASAEVAALASVVPFTVLVKVTVAPVTKPEPVIVSRVGEGAGTESTRPVALSEVAAGAESTTMAPAKVAVPLSSTTVTL
jgi:hypothetical protein